MQDKVLHSTAPGTPIAFLTALHVIPSKAQFLEPPLHVLLPSMLFYSIPKTFIACLTALYVIPSVADTLACIAPRVLPQPLLLLPHPSGMSSQMLVPLAPSLLYGFSRVPSYQGPF